MLSPGADASRPHTTTPSQRPAAPREGGELAEGTRVGRYSILGRLGEGDTGVVYEAWDPQLDRHVALKVLHADRARAEGPSADVLIAEAQTLAKIVHPNIVTVFDAGTSEEQVFLAMELCRGQNMQEWLAKGSHRVREILDVFVAAGRGLAAAHHAGVIHRNFKPANVLIGKGGAVRVVAFSMARIVALPSEGEGTHSPPEHDLCASSIVGTPTYMAPEQLLGRRGDHRMDQFSFCLSLYWALLDHSPFPGRTLQERRRSVPLGLGLDEREQLSRARKVPVRVRRAILRGLSVEPEDRFPSMEELLSQLTERRRWPWALSALALATGLGLGALAKPEPPPEACASPEAGLGEAWGPAARQGLAAAIERTRHPHAAALLEHATRAFDRYADAWKDAYSHACESTYVTRVQSNAAFELRMRCLDRRRAQLELASTILAEAADPQQLDARMTVPFRLPAIDECGDVTAIENGMPPDATTHEPIHALVRRIDLASTMREAGLVQEGLVVATAAVDEARELGNRPLLAQALECLGRLQVDGVASPTAEATLREAITVGTQCHDDRTVARAWPSLLRSLVMQHELATAKSLGFAAEVAIERTDDRTARGWLHHAFGVLELERGELERARAELERAIAITIQLRGDDDIDVGIARIDLGFALLDAGRRSEASDAFRQAQAILAATVGPTHSLNDMVLGGRCRVENERGRHDVALALCSEALDRPETRSGSPVTKGMLQLQLARALHGLGDRDRARKLALAARRRVDSANPGTHPGMASDIDAWLEQAWRTTGAHPREGSSP